MKKYLTLISAWAVVFAVGCTARAVGPLRADPTDDFSFSLAQKSGLEEYRFMPERRVTQILQDRLDLFPKAEAPKLAHHLLELCKQYRFDPAFILALIQVESGFKIKAVSPYGAVGLMQVMPSTAVVTAQTMGVTWALKKAGRVLTDPFANILIGVAYLSWLRDHYRGMSSDYLVAAYNIGPARMDELMTRKSFKPTATRRYFEAIRRGVPGFRYYRHEA